MKHPYWPKLAPALLIAAGILTSTFAAEHTAASGCLVMSGPFILALAIAGADALAARLSGQPARPSQAALLMGMTVLVAGAIAALRGPSVVIAMLPTFGIVAWIVLQTRPEGERDTCKIL